MIIQLTFLLYAYIAFVVVWVFFSVVAVYHMFKFGFKTMTTFVTTVIFISVALIMLLISLNYVYQIDWTQEIQLFRSFTNPDIII